MNPGHRYGEPHWIGNPSLPHNEQDLATCLQSDLSYEELRAGTLLANQCTCKPPVLSQDDTTASIVQLQGLTEMIKVIVGSQDATWLIHERLFMEISGFARTLLSRPSAATGASQPIFRLPYEDPATFEHFVRYVYSRRLIEMSVTGALKLYTLAFRLQAPCLCDLILGTADQWVHLSEPSDVQYIMDNTVIFDRLRRIYLLHISKWIVQPGLAPYNLIASEICNKYPREILSFMNGRIDIEDHLIANNTYTGIPFVLHVGREMTTSSNATTSAVPAPASVPKPEAIPNQSSRLTSTPTPRSNLGPAAGGTSEALSGVASLERLQKALELLNESTSPVETVGFGHNASHRISKEPKDAIQDEEGPVSKVTNEDK